MLPYINIHTHRPTGRGIELRTAGIHPWEADSQDVEAFAARFADKGGSDHPAKLGVMLAYELGAAFGKPASSVAYQARAAEPMPPSS